MSSSFRSDNFLFISETVLSVAPTDLTAATLWSLTACLVIVHPAAVVLPPCLTSRPQTPQYLCHHCAFFFNSSSDMIHRSLPLVNGFVAFMLDIHKVLCIEHMVESGHLQVDYDLKRGNCVQVCLQVVINCYMLHHFFVFILYSVPWAARRCSG